MSIRDEYAVRHYTGLDTQFPLDLPVSDDLWKQIKDSIKRSSSPGVDFIYFYKSNGDLLDNDETELRRRVDARLRARLEWDFSKYSQLTPDERKVAAMAVVEEGLVDPVRVFIKNEPTKKDKQSRIINSVSVVDSCCQRVTSLQRANKWISSWCKGVSSAGIQLKDVECMKYFRDKTQQFLGQSVESTDVQGFEYSFGAACHKIALDIETYMACGSFDPAEPSVEIRLLRAETQLSMLPRVVLTSNGDVHIVDFVWLQSGKFTTSFAGTHVRSALVSIAATIRDGFPVLVNAKSNGDDCLNSYVGDLTDAYLKMGFRITDQQVSIGAQPWGFCSHVIAEESHYPESYTKTLLSFLSQKVISAELFDQFAFVNQLRPDWEEMKQFLVEHFSLG